MILALILALVGYACGLVFVISLAVIAGRADRRIEGWRDDHR